MAAYYLTKTIYSLFFVSAFLNSCQGQVKTKPQTENQSETKTSPIGQAKLTKTQGSKEGCSVNCSVEDKAGNLWFGTTGEGVYRYDGKLFYQYTIQDGLNHNNVWSICEDKTGNIWFGTSNGVCRYDGNKFTPISIGSGSNFQVNGSLKLKNKIRVSHNGGVNEENSVWSIIQAKQGTLWFGTTDGIYKYDGQTFSFFTHNDGIPNNTGFHINKVESILEDNNGTIWFGGRLTEGLFCFNGKTLNHLSPDGDNWLVPRLEDKSGNIWFGSRRHSVYRYDGKSFFNFADNELQGWVVSMAEDNKGKLWFSTEKGVTKYDGTKMTYLTVKDGLKNDYMNSLMCAKSGTIWIGTGGLGLYRYDGKTLTSFSE